jgi:hypothetical protein
MAFALLAPVTMSPLAPMMFGLMGPLHWLYGALAARRRSTYVAAQR